MFINCKIGIAFALLYFAIISCCAQELYNPYQFKGKRLNFNIETELENFNFEKLGTDKAGMNSKFAEVSVYGKSELLKSGEVCYDWPEVNDYLTKIVNKIIPDSVNEVSSEVYLIKSADMNAFTIYDGSIFLNTGLIAELINEASLAVLLGHEISHFIYRDGQSMFPRSLKRKRKSVIDRNTASRRNVKSSHLNREFETRCDTIGLMWADDAGYDISCGTELYSIMLGMEEVDKIGHVESRVKKISVQELKKLKWMSSDEVKRLLASHPELKARVKFLREFMNSVDNSKGKKNFLIDKDAFFHVRNLARYETLQYLLNETEYYLCALRAFRYHLQDPDNVNFIYFLAESLRRLDYIDPERAEEGFLTNKNKVGELKGSGILHDLSLLSIDPNSINIEYEKTLINDGLAFETNRAALLYFLALGKEKGIEEIWLTAALFEDDEDFHKEYLRNYLLSPNARYKYFAKALQNGSENAWINESEEKYYVLIGKNRYYDFKDFGPYQKHAYSTTQSIKYKIRMTEELLKLNKNLKYSFIDELRTSDLDRYVTIENIFINAELIKKENFSETESDAYYNDIEEVSGEAIELVLLAPEYWKTLNELSVSKLFYFNYFQFRVLYDNTGDGQPGKYSSGIESYYYWVRFDYSRRKVGGNDTRYTNPLKWSDIKDNLEIFEEKEDEKNK